ncbi:hypothetical protein Terro_0470 [Terriglobus roseus DSM 18391]|uniref:DUF5666 domain-containing protein n=1 Tax=Terriglobus roseus (strain DSM 18391 / NRRL B-41598 / KBS 63) TaxID=926566 RepID=I3ZC44_TERRK|nr:hypothetical protein [Terriglobus roseus]AFL86812.1 hypothetical protein Terro_0470 [Terriglobus roseus DSM 18391]
MKALALVLATFAGIAAAQSPIPLPNGKAVTLHGTIEFVPQGRVQFATVRTKEAYVPILGSAGKTRRGTVLHQVALNGYHRYDLLAAHRGQAVTVTGKMMTNAGSPYYYKNASLTATSIRLQDGTELLGEARSQTVAADVGIVRATVTLPSDLTAPWTYDGPAFSDSQRPAACSSNGGGDVVNCYCPLNFRATEATMTTGNEQAAGKLMGQMAQFTVGDEARTVTLKLSCMR